MDNARYQKALLNEILDDACIQRRDLLTNPDKDFKHSPKLPLKTMLQIMISMQGGTIKSELQRYDWTKRVSASAFVQQRERIKPEMFKHIFDTYNRMSDENKRYKGYKLLAVDGTSICIPKNPDSETYIENGDREGYNQFQICAMYDVLNRTYLDCIVQPKQKSHEVEACRQMVCSNTFDKAILLGDRYYGSLNLMETINRTEGLDFLFRVKNSWLREIGKLPMKELDTEICFDVFNPAIEKANGNRHYNKRNNKRHQSKHLLQKRCNTWHFESPCRMQLRVVRIRLSVNSYETIVTSLNRFEFPLKRIKELYHERWGIETSFRELKYAIGLSNLHARKESSILQEIYARMIMYNFCQRIITHVVITQDNNRKWTYQINRTYAIETCRRYFQYTGDEPPDIETMIAHEILPVRPNRSDERKLKPKSVVYFLYRVA